MTCPFCREEVITGAIRCKHCQADISPGVCLSCGKRNRLESKFCGFCGSPELFGTKALRKKIAAQAEAEAYSENRAASEAQKKIQIELLKIFIDNMALIPAGEFLMGSPEDEGREDEHPRHKLHIDAFYIDKYQVTVTQYREFCKASASYMPQQPKWSTDRHPIVNISWHEATAYCSWAGKHLPTEAEWEKAARGETKTKYSFGNNAVEGSFLGFGGTDMLDKYTWYADNSNLQAHTVGQKEPNNYGLYDMHGNVWEWVSDWYASNYYRKSSEKNPKGPDSGTARGLRGGAWDNRRFDLRTANRLKDNPDSKYNNIGFRSAWSPPKTTE